MLFGYFFRTKIQKIKENYFFISNSKFVIYTSGLWRCRKAANWKNKRKAFFPKRKNKQKKTWELIINN